MDVKQMWLKESPTEVLERVLSQFNPDHEADKERFPLADRVHISGIGQVYFKDIHKELDARS